MKPSKEISIREYLPGYYDVEVDGRTYTETSREALRLRLSRELGGIPDSPEVLEEVRELKESLLDQLTNDRV